MAYLVFWLVVALGAVAVLSAFIARQRRLREMRRQQGAHLLDALERYASWVVVQRRAPSFEGETPEVAQALDEACSIRMGWFPELSSEMAELLAVHNRLVNFLSSQQSLRLRDPEAWLDSDHDLRFMAMWRQECFVMEEMQQKLSVLAGTQAPAENRQSTYA